MGDVTHLLERLKAAGEHEEHRLVHEAITLAHQHGWISTGKYHQAKRCADARAHLDAALPLVPEDPANPGKPMLWSISYDEDGVAGERSYCASLGKGYHDPEFIYGDSDTNPALATVIAALTARQEMEAQSDA